MCGWNRSVTFTVNQPFSASSEYPTNWVASVESVNSEMFAEDHAHELMPYLATPWRKNRAVRICRKATWRAKRRQAQVGHCLSYTYSRVVSILDRSHSASVTICGVSQAKLNHGETLSKVAIFSGLTEAELSFLAHLTVP